MQFSSVVALFNRIIISKYFWKAFYALSMISGYVNVMKNTEVIKLD